MPTSQQKVVVTLEPIPNNVKISVGDFMSSKGTIPTPLTTLEVVGKRPRDLDWVGITFYRVVAVE